MTRYALVSQLAGASFFVAIGSLFACSAPADDDDLGSTSQAATGSGKAKAGDACLLHPVYRKDKCAPSLTCATIGGATHGVCVSRNKESEACNPAYGGADCASGLSCSAKPNGGGFCKGAGTGPCKTSNAGLDCASGRTCVPDVLGGTDGTCRTSGGEGTSCNVDLVLNGCDPNLECVEVPGSTVGICTNTTSGGLGAPCGVGQPQPDQCAAPYLCAVAPEMRTGPFPGQASMKYRCAAPLSAGAQCFGGGQSACYGDMTLSYRNAECIAFSPIDRLTTDPWGVGVCDVPAGPGEHCGSHGVDNCLASGGPPDYRRQMCIGHVCVDAYPNGGHCVAGQRPDGQTTSNCPESIRTRSNGSSYVVQAACVNGTCQP